MLCVFYSNYVLRFEQFYITFWDDITLVMVKVLIAVDSSEHAVNAFHCKCIVAYELE